MIAVAATAALVVGWALLHRASGRDGWGFVGYPPTKWMVMQRAIVQSFERALRAFGVAFQLALGQAARSMRTWGQAWAALPKED